jgi:hypothetical protein
VPPDGKRRTILLPLDKVGLYRIDVNDGSDLTEVTWPAGQRMTWKMSLDEHPQAMSGRWGLWFYVPRGTKKIGLYAKTGGGQILRPDGSEAFDLTQQPGRFLAVDVPPQSDGTFWKLNHVSGKVFLLNVPPYLARTPQELLLPADVE